MIQFSDVTKFYDDDLVLKNVTFTIEKGELAFLTGPSGVGKTTLLKLIYAAELPDEGNIVGAKGIVQDITESKQVEELLLVKNVKV